MEYSLNINLILYMEIHFVLYCICIVWRIWGIGMGLE